MIFYRARWQNFIKLVKTAVHPKVSGDVEREILKENVHSMHSISIVITAVESMILMLFLLGHQSDIRYHTDSVLSVFLCIAASFAMAVHSAQAIRKKADDAARLKKEQAWIVGYFIVIALWGMQASLRHYRAGEQMLTFFIVEMAFVSFLTIRPIIGLYLIVFSYILFYLLLYQADQAAKINGLNYLAMAILLWVAITARYHLQARQIEQRFEVELLNGELKRLSLTDALTGLGNRMALQKEFSEVMGHSVILMMADIDQFKMFNDQYGHEVGDMVLKAVAGKLKAHFPVRCCFRYGGDEYLVIMKDVDEDSFSREMQDWLRDVRQIRIADVPVLIACSAGLASGRTESKEGIRSLISQADQNLYTMKVQHHHTAGI